MKDLVSVIICIYNGEEYIEKCLASVINQTYKHIEIIVVDDGSIDNTYNILKKYPNIKYIYQSNKGLASARNLGISQVNGKYITMLDVDDLYIEDKIEKQVEHLKKHPDVDIVCNDSVLIDENDKEIKVMKVECNNYLKEDFLANLLFRQPIHCTASMMIKRECFEYITYPEDVKCSEDYYLTIEFAKRYQFGYLPEVLYKYRRHANNMTNNMAKQQENEIAIVTNLGVESIEEYVNMSTLLQEEKALLLAKILFKIKEYAMAVNILEGIDFDGDNIFFKYFYLGNIYYMLNDYCNAEDNYKKAIENSPNRAEAYNNCGASVWKQGDLEQAKQYFNKALQMRQEYLDPKFNLEEILNGKSPRITIRELRDSLMRY